MNTDKCGLLEFLRDTHHLVGGGYAARYLRPAVFAQIAHADAPSRVGDGHRILVLHDQLPNAIVQLHQLEDSHSAGVAGSKTLIAAAALETLHQVAVGSEPGAVSALAMFAND